MTQQWEEIGHGLKVRKDTPKEVRLTQDFVRDLTKDSESKVFTEKVAEMVEPAPND